MHGIHALTIGPASGGTGRALKEALRASRPDDAWAGELRELRESIDPCDGPLARLIPDTTVLVDAERRGHGE